MEGFFKTGEAGRKPSGDQGPRVSALVHEDVWRTTGMAESAEKGCQENLGTMQHEGKYLTFSMGQENYGIGIRKVKEIIGMISITSVPQTPAFFKGVINLRGKVIPVVDLRVRFGMEQVEYTERTCIVVVEVPGKAATQLMGVVVDSVSEVVNIKGEDIEETPSFGTDLDSDYILGLAKISGGVKILLDIDRTLCTEHMDLQEIAVS
jgi:purine-binding chemotaxis protein CheW